MSEHLVCSSCRKKVSTPFHPIDDFVLRAWVECPECIEKHPAQLASTPDREKLRESLRTLLLAPSSPDSTIREGMGKHWCGSCMTSCHHLWHERKWETCDCRATCKDPLINSILALTEEAKEVVDGQERQGEGAEDGEGTP